MKKQTQKSAPKLSAFEKQVVKALEHIFTVEGWEIPDEAVEGKLTAKLLKLEERVNAMTQTPTVKRIDTIAAMKGGAK